MSNGDVTLRFSDISELDSSIQKLADAAGSTVREVLPAQMRLFAADLAFNTRPVGKTSSSGKELQVKILMRLSMTYGSVGGAYDWLKNDAKAGPGVAAKFSRLVKSGKYSEAASVLNTHGKTDRRYSVGMFDGGELHRKQRFVRKPREMLICVDFKNAVKYGTKEIKLVGFAKGGFAAGARQLGGVRGIPGFATRQKSPGTGSVTGDGKTLAVTLTNDVRYIENALDAHGEARAIEHRQKAVTSVIKRMMDRKMRAASRSLK